MASTETRLSIQSRCPSCGLSWAQAGAKFWVMVPQSVPPPEETDA